MKSIISNERKTLKKEKTEERREMAEKQKRE